MACDNMTTLTRQQLLDIDANVLSQLIDALPADLQDQVLLALAGLIEGDMIDIPSGYLEGIVDDL